MDTESLEHLANHLVGALNQNLHWPPLIVCHVIQEPFTSCLWCIELFCQKLHPLHHSWLKHHVRAAEIQIYKMYLINNLQLHHEDIFILITGFHSSALCQGMGIFSGPWLHFSFNPSGMSCSSLASTKCVSMLFTYSKVTTGFNFSLQQA